MSFMQFFLYYLMSTMLSVALVSSICLLLYGGLIVHYRRQEKRGWDNLQKKYVKKTK